MTIDPDHPEQDGFVLRIDIPGPLPSLNQTYRIKRFGTRLGLGKATNVKAWQKKVQFLARSAACGQRPCFDRPVVVEAQLRFPRKSSLVPNLPFGDIDGPVKALLDALSGIAYADDILVQRLVLTKYLDRDNPGALVFVSEAH